MGSCGMCFNCGKIIIKDWSAGDYSNEILLCNDCLEKMNKFCEIVGNHPIEFSNTVKTIVNNKNT